MTWLSSDIKLYPLEAIQGAVKVCASDLSAPTDATFDIGDALATYTFIAADRGTITSVGTISSSVVLAASSTLAEADGTIRSVVWLDSDDGIIYYKTVDEVAVLLGDTVNFPSLTCVLSTTLS